MIGLFFICCIAVFVIAVILGVALPDNTMDGILEKSGFVMVGGIPLGIIIFVVGLFTNTGQYEQQSYEDWHGNTVTYMADKLSDRIWLGIFIGLFSIAAPIVFGLGAVAGQGLRGRLKN